MGYKVGYLWYCHGSIMNLYSSHKLKYPKSHTQFFIWFFHSSFMVLECPNVKLVLFTEAQIIKLIDEKLVGVEWEKVLVVDKLPDPPAQDPAKEPGKATPKEPQKEPEG